MSWWGWLIFIVAVCGGATLLTAGAIIESRHRDAEYGRSRARTRKSLRMLGSALRRDTPAFTGHVSMCIGCGQTDGTHVDRFGSPCPYKGVNDERQ